MRKFITLFIIVFSLLSIEKNYACTSAIITGKLTPDGRPLMLKNRDTGHLDNRLDYYKGEKYPFLGLINSDGEVNSVWGGTNSVGFSIMNTASYNLQKDKDGDMEGNVMYRALGLCKNIDDFEKFLNDLPRPMGVHANFGVIDAEGGAAYYEVNNLKWTKVDVNDPKIAPLGYLVYTNFSYTGEFNKGKGYVRYYSASKVMLEKAYSGNFTPEWLFDNIARSFYHSFLDIDLRESIGKREGNGWFVDQDFIPRRSTSCTMVFQGINEGDEIGKSVMWLSMGYPPLAVAIPYFVKYGENLPSFITKTPSSDHSELCDIVLSLKQKVFPFLGGDNATYFNFGLLYNSNNDGYAQRLRRVEQNVFSIFKDPIKNKEELIQRYNTIYKEIKSEYNYLISK